MVAKRKAQIYIWAYLFKFDDLRVDCYQPKYHKYIHVIFKLFGS